AGLSACPPASHLPDLEVALHVGQRLDDQGHDGHENRCLDQVADHASSPSGSISSGAKYRNLPWLPCSSASGSPAGLTATCTWPSTSNSTACTSASRPARNRSWASARRAPGRRTTVLPRATRTPRTMTWSVCGDTESSEPGSHHGADGGGTGCS